MNINEFPKIVPTVRKAPFQYLWSSYDPDADVLYINFKKPSHATDSEITDNDIVVRYENGEVAGLTSLNASKRWVQVQNIGNTAGSIHR